MVKNILSDKNNLTEIKKMQPQLVTWFHALHQIPEIELSLPKTVAYVSAQLTAMGVKHQILPNSTGIIALIGKQGPVIAVRGDMDALDICENTQLSFASKNGHMHACGHDSHAAILLTIAKYLQAHENELKGRVKLLFQTAEEVLRGAKYMIEQGALENPKPIAILALHSGGFQQTYPTGHLTIAESVGFYSSDSFEITVKGKGGHAASPQAAVDPIVIAADIIENLQQLISREVHPGIPAVLSVTHIHAGNETYNVIPDEAFLMGGIRTTNAVTRQMLLKRAKEICEKTAAVMRAEATFKLTDGAPPLVNDKVVSEQVYASIQKLFPQEVHWIKEPNNCSEDAAYFFEKVPGCYISLCSLGQENKVFYPHHNAKFRLEEDVLWKGAAALVQAALDLMESNS